MSTATTPMSLLLLSPPLPSCRRRRIWPYHLSGGFCTQSNKEGEQEGRKLSLTTTPMPLLLLALPLSSYRRRCDWSYHSLGISVRKATGRRAGRQEVVDDDDAKAIFAAAAVIVAASPPP